MLCLYLVEALHPVRILLLGLGLDKVRKPDLGVDIQPVLIRKGLQTGVELILPVGEYGLGVVELGNIGLVKPFVQPYRKGDNDYYKYQREKFVYIHISVIVFRPSISPR